MVAILSDLSPSSGVIDLGKIPDSPVVPNPNALGSAVLKPMCLKLTSLLATIPSVWSGAEEPV